MGMVTDIQRFSLNDGPGIRTTVFLKGCNLACAWCHNPETLQMAPEILIDPSHCIGCGACVGFDPARMEKGLPPRRGDLTPEMAAMCVTGALTVAGREMTVEEILPQIEADINYYRNSGGGVTLSGGEALMQPAFAKALLAACREKGIPTAIETNLAYAFETLLDLAPVVDLIMADIKLLDPARHREVTGMDNARILENARRLPELKIPFILRTPVVPGVSDSAEAIGAVAAFIAKNARENLLYYELLNFNPLGGSKYIGLGAENPYAAAKPLSDEEMEALKRAAESQGIPVRVG